jgi:lipocalin
MKTSLLTTLLALASTSAGAQAQTASEPPLQPLSALDVASYMGTWYQVLWMAPSRWSIAVARPTANPTA